MRLNWQLWEGLLSPDTCKDLVDKCYKSVKLYDATVFSSGDYSSNKEIRDTRVGFVDLEEITTIIMYYCKEANRAAFGFDVDYLPQVQFAEYSEGSFYNWHHDINWEGSNMYDRKLSVGVQLTDPSTYEGGDFEFQHIEDPIGFRTQGSVLVFPSYNVHRVTEITRGTRHSLVAWLEGPRWR